MTENQLETKSEFEPWPKEKDDDKESKELKGEKEKDELKDNKDEQKELFPENKLGDEGVENVKFALLQQVESLEATARTLRHFIAPSERPDLKRGALRGEPEDG